MADGKVYQTSPAWVVTFVRFENRMPKVLGSSFGDAVDARLPMVVINDCVDVTVSDVKGSPNGTASLSLKNGDINYLTAIAPGDYFIVNIVDHEEKAVELYKRILGDRGAGPANINNYHDGFCGVFKVQSVHKNRIVAGDGKKVAGARITGYSFTELNNTIYFNPYLVSQGEKNNDVLFLTQLSSQWNKIIGLKNNNNSVQDLMILLFQVFLGRGFNEQGRTLKGGLSRTENNLYLIPGALGRLLGHPKAKYAADLVNLVCGIQKYKSRGKGAPPREFLNPELTANGRVFTTPNKVRGVSYAKPEYWNQVKVWDILQSYLNNTVNEMYTTNRPDPVTGNVMPTLVIRQKPFTSDRYASANPAVTVTPFRTLPRWKPDPSEVISDDTGRDDGLRINFVQVFGRSQSLMGGSNADVDQQIAMGNYDIDREDIKRHGLRPYITSSSFDYAAADVNGRLSEAPTWAKLVGDWVIGGHMKMSGSITMRGWDLPIAPGDNLEWDDVVYHIEGVQKIARIQDGRRSFMMTLQLSNGVSVEELSGKTEYAEMTHTDADNYRRSKKKGKDKEIIDPGVSDSQDLPLAANRSNAEKTGPNPSKPFDSPAERAKPAPATKIILAEKGNKK
jgi:hypothetical protein